MRCIKTKREYIVNEEKNQGGSKRILWVFFLLVFFLLILFPFFGASMRYKTGSTLFTVFEMVGIVCFSLGCLVIAWGILMLFCTRSFKAIGVMLVGFVLVIFGSMFAHPGLFDIAVNGETVPRGYN